MKRKRRRRSNKELAWIAAKREEIEALTVKGLTYGLLTCSILLVLIGIVCKFSGKPAVVTVCVVAALIYEVWIFQKFSSLDLQGKRLSCERQIKNITGFLAENKLTGQELKELDRALFEFEKGEDLIFLGEENLKLTDHFMIISIGKDAGIDVVKVDTICSGNCSEEDEGYIDFDFYDADGKALAFGISLSGEALDKKEQIVNEINGRYGKIISL